MSELTDQAKGLLREIYRNAYTTAYHDGEMLDLPLAWVRAVIAKAVDDATADREAGRPDKVARRLWAWMRASETFGQEHIASYEAHIQGDA